jgi:dienelactone hydrolase
MEQLIKIPTAEATLEGDLAVPDGARGVVLFAHGSGSSRHSPRNRYVAGVLQQAGLATLLMDLLTAEEEEAERYTRHLRFDIGLLSARLSDAIDWLALEPSTRALNIGLFGASTGGAAALVAAAERPEKVRAVVSRGGRPDLAGDALSRVKAPTLLLVGSLDTVVIELNGEAMRQLRCEHKLHLVPNATHLFEEPGTLEEVAQLARDWFIQYLTRPVNLTHTGGGRKAMRSYEGISRFLLVPCVLTALVVSLAVPASAHCNGMDGPVVKAAQAALEQGNVNQVLIWVQKDDEPELRRAFEQTVEVRKLSPQAKQLADTYFF